MKFTFVGILCVHTLKVLDKKNVKRLPTHYILKRWTQDAKVGSIKDHHGIVIKGDVQELMGKRYSHLSHNFREIATLAAESEMMYEYANVCFEKLLTDLEEMRKRCYFSSIEGRIEVHGEIVPGDALQCDIRFESHEDITFPGICGIKTKPTVGRLRNRLKNALEQRKNSKSRSKKIQAFNRVSGLQQKAREGRQVQSLGCSNKVRYVTFHYNT
jgi:zinc finger SWIM domain-containing protein 3